MYHKSRLHDYIGGNKKVQLMECPSTARNWGTEKTVKSKKGHRWTNEGTDRHMNRQIKEFSDWQSRFHNVYHQDRYKIHRTSLKKIYYLQRVKVPIVGQKARKKTSTLFNFHLFLLLHNTHSIHLVDGYVCTWLQFLYHQSLPFPSSCVEGKMKSSKTSQQVSRRPHTEAGALRPRKLE